MNKRIIFKILYAVLFAMCLNLSRLPVRALNEKSCDVYKGQVTEDALVYNGSSAETVVADNKQSLNDEEFEKIFIGEADPFENFTPRQRITSDKSPKFSSGLNVFAAISPIDEKNRSKIIYALQWREKPTFTYDDVLNFNMTGNDSKSDLAVDIRDYTLIVKYATKSGEYMPEYEEKFTGDAYGALAEYARGIKMKKITPKGVLYAKEIIFTGTVRPAVSGAHIESLALYIGYEHCIFKGNRENAGQIRLAITADRETGKTEQYISGAGKAYYGVAAFALKYLMPVLTAAVVAGLAYMIVLRLKKKADKAD